MRRPRPTVRSMMVAVAIAGLALGAGEAARRRAQDFESRALEARNQNHALFHAGGNLRFEAMMLREGAKVPAPGEPSGDPYIRSLEEEADTYTARGRWAGDLAIKYDRAARWPWLPVWPDPPEPR